MSVIKIADFYYGAVLSMLFNKHINPGIIESSADRQVYDLTTDNGDCRLFIKYRAQKQNIKKQDYSSWQFVFATSEISEIKGYIDNGYILTMALVCGVAGLSGSEVAVLDIEQIKELLSLNKTSLTISRIKNERSYRVSVGGGRNNSMQVKANRFDDVFTAKQY